MSKPKNRKGKVIVLTAPSGSGKTSIAKRLLNDFDNLKFSVSATTRKPRDGEINGKDYFFLSDEEFQHKIETGDFLEWEEFYNNTRYGTLRSEVDKQLESGYFILLDVEVKGALNIKDIYDDDCLTIFIRPPSLKVIGERLTNRGTETEETLALRMQRAKMEIEFADKFDVAIINDDFETAYGEAKEVVERFIKQ